MLEGIYNTRSRAIPHQLETTVIKIFNRTKVASAFMTIWFIINLIINYTSLTSIILSSIGIIFMICFYLWIESYVTINTKHEVLNHKFFIHVKNYRKINANERYGQVLFNVAFQLGYDVQQINGTRHDPFHQTEHTYRFLHTVLGEEIAEQFLQTPLGRKHLEKYGVSYVELDKEFL